MILQQHATGSSMPLLSPEEKAHRGLEYLRDALISMMEQRQSILKSEQKVFDLIPERRSVKILENASKDNEKIPELSFNGKWLQEAGFHCNQHASIFVVQDMLLICPQAALVEESAPN
jgi:hypothetical protein